MRILLSVLLVLIVLVPALLAPATAEALPFELCCRLGNPGCCFFLMIDLWWDGGMDFPAPEMPQL